MARVNILVAWTSQPATGICMLVVTISPAPTLAAKITWLATTTLLLVVMMDHAPMSDVPTHWLAITMQMLDVKTVRVSIQDALIS